MTLDRGFWDERWSTALREHGDEVAKMPPNAHLTAVVGELRPGRALDAGCGAATPAAGQVQVSVAQARAALDTDRWEFLVAEERRRAAAATGVGAVISARRRTCRLSPS